MKTTRTNRLSRTPFEDRLKFCIKFLSAHLKTRVTCEEWAPKNGFDATTIGKWLMGRHGKKGRAGICREWRSLSDMAMRKWLKDARARLRTLPQPIIHRVPPIPQLIAPRSHGELVQEALNTALEGLTRLQTLLKRQRKVK